MIERHVTFDVLPGKEGELEGFFRSQYASAMKQQPGFGGFWLLKESEASHRHQMVTRFQTEEAAADWRNSKQHKALSPRLKALHQGSELVVDAVVHEA